MKISNKSCCFCLWFHLNLQGLSGIISWLSAIIPAKVKVHFGFACPSFQKGHCAGLVHQATLFFLVPSWYLMSDALECISDLSDLECLPFVKAGWK